MDILAAEDFIYDELLDDSSYEEHEDFLDSYGDDSDYYHDHMHRNSEQTVQELFFHCLRPTLQDVWWQFLWPILTVNFLAFILITFVNHLQRIKRFTINEFILIISGYSLLINHYYFENFNQLLFLTVVIIMSSIFISILITYDIHDYYGLKFVWSTHLIVIALNEFIIFFITDSSDWIKLRPNLMLILMKSISYFHEKQFYSKKKKDLKNNDDFPAILLEYSAYILHPCTIILGIWHPFNDPKKLFATNQNLKQTFINSFCSLLLSLLFLLCSTCLIDYFFEHIVFEYLDALIRTLVENPQTSYVWLFFIRILRSYSIAIQFHYSHYFICYLGQSMFDLWKFDQQQQQITKPLSIEWPRSLVDVVVAWNIPMHQWLKRYVFQIMKNNLQNIYLTILATYFLSSYLHGFNFQIWTVLLTLGLITQAEFKLRKSLANFWSACVESRKCQYDYYVYDDDDDNDDNNYSLVCRHGHRNIRDVWSVRLTNLFFTILALFHLAFLGATFDGQPDSSTIENVWTVWKDLHFYPFITMTIMFIVYKIISFINS
ncbi:protein-serine O-palmitoleoyltransferase por [Dermatophagoides pteronyssinus]|uniref:protein-serine O-palmitoleoyltransferase por n=1 Tax=Dermatophagoides pteronyssinus TaxID=6956 RepID=UPI003F67BCF4